MLIANLIGRLGEDARVVNVNGRETVSLRVAHNFKKKGEDCVLWVTVFVAMSYCGNLLDKLCKGARIYCCGSLIAWSYVDGNGQARCDSRLYASHFCLLDNNNQQGEHDGF